MTDLILARETVCNAREGKAKVKYAYRREVRHLPHPNAAPCLRRDLLPAMGES